MQGNPKTLHEIFKMSIFLFQGLLLLLLRRLYNTIWIIILNKISKNKIIQNNYPTKYSRNISYDRKRSKNMHIRIIVYHLIVWVVYSDLKTLIHFIPHIYYFDWFKRFVIMINDIYYTMLKKLTESMVYKSCAIVYKKFAPALSFIYNILSFHVKCQYYTEHFTTRDTYH